MFKALLYIGVDPQSEGVKIAPPLFKVLIIHARIFGGPLMGLARSLLSMQEVFLNCAGRFGRDMLGLAGDDDIDLESQTHDDVSVDIFRLLLVHATQLLISTRQGPINTTPNFR